MANPEHSNQPGSDADAPLVEVAPVETSTAPANGRQGDVVARRASRGARLPRPSEAATPTKAEALLKKLRSAKGATIEALMEVTGWQAHSVRGFLSGTAKKKLGLPINSEIGKDGVRRYRIADSNDAG